MRSLHTSIVALARHELAVCMLVCPYKGACSCGFIVGLPLAHQEPTPAERRERWRDVQKRVPGRSMCSNFTHNNSSSSNLPSNFCLFIDGWKCMQCTNTGPVRCIIYRALHREHCCAGCSFVGSGAAIPTRGTPISSVQSERNTITLGVSFPV